MSKDNISFNINSCIRVKIKDKGFQHMADEHNKYIGIIPRLRIITPEFMKLEKEDGDGYVEFQMWDFMQLFGSVTQMGMTKFYETTILLNKRNLR